MEAAGRRQVKRAPQVPPVYPARMSAAFDSARAGANKVALFCVACLLGIAAGGAGGLSRFHGSDGAGAFFAMVFGGAAGAASGVACGITAVLLAGAGRNGAGWAVSALGAPALGAALGALTVLAI